MTRREFSADANIPLMIWYGVEPLVHDDLSRFVKMAIRSELTLVRRHIARRVAAMSQARAGLEQLVDALAESEATDKRRELLEGILTGLEGTRSVAMPGNWNATYAKLRESPDESVRELALRLSLIFDDPVAIRSLIDQATDPKAAAEVRRRAIEVLTARE